MKHLKFIPLFALIPTLLTGCNIFRYDSYDYSDKYTLIDGNYSFSDEQLKFEKIDINWGNGTLNIASSDTGTISFSETGNQEIKEDLKARYFISDKTLFIQYAKSKVTYNNKFKKEATITINQNLASLANLTYTANVAIGELNASGITSKSINLSVAYGDIKTQNISAEVIRSLCDKGLQEHNNIDIQTLGEFKTNYGKCDIITSENIVGFELDLNVVAGSFFVNGTKFPKQSETFYGAHKEKDLKLVLIQNYGDLSII